MTPGQFNASYDKIRKLLKSLKLFRLDGVRQKISSQFIGATLEGDYRKIYSTAVSNFDFDFLLTDESFLQFQYVS